MNEKIYETALTQLKDLVEKLNRLQVFETTCYRINPENWVRMKNSCALDENNLEIIEKHKFKQMYDVKSLLKKRYNDLTLDRKEKKNVQ